MQAQTPEVSAEKATTPDELRLVSVEQLKKIHRDLDACQKVIWLAGCRPRGYGFDPSYVTDAQERLKEIEALLAESAPQALKMPAQVTAAMWRAAHVSMETDGDLALALQEALNAAPQCRHRFMYFGDQKKRRCADCCVVEGNEQTAPQPEHSELAEVLHEAERFIAGFEGCELQEGIDELLMRIRAAQSELGGSHA